MGVITKGLITKSVISYSQPIYLVGTSQGSSAGNSTLAAASTPAAIMPGDLVIGVVSNNGAAGTWTPPTGYTELVDQNATPNLSIAWKLWVAGDSTTPTWTSTVSSQTVINYMVFRNALIDQTGTLGSVTTGTAATTATAITTSVNNTLVIAAFAGSNGSTFSVPTGFYQILHYNVSNTPNTVFGKWTTTAGTTGTVTTTPASGTGSNVGMLFNIRPKF